MRWPVLRELCVAGIPLGLMLGGFLFAMVVTASADPVPKAQYLDLVRKGWVFEFRSNIRRRGASMPEVRMNGHGVAKGTWCVVGEEPHPATLKTLMQFGALLERTYGSNGGFEYAGKSVEDCGFETIAFIRLYSGMPRSFAYRQDLEILDARFDIGLAKAKRRRLTSPAETSGFFGRLGTATFIVVQQPRTDEMTPVENTYFRSILIEELLHAVTLGLDIQVFDRKARLLSKLQETPFNILRFPDWSDEAFMAGLMGSNPVGLCFFDLLMLHALAQTDLASTNTVALVDFVDGNFEALVSAAHETAALPEFAALLDADCLETK